MSVLYHLCRIPNGKLASDNFFTTCLRTTHLQNNSVCGVGSSDIDDVITSTFMASQTERCREQVRYSHTPVPGSHDGDSYLTLAVEVALIGMRKTACLDFTISLAASSVYQLHVMYVAVT